MNAIHVKSYALSEISVSEVLRYAGVKSPDNAMLSLLSECENLTRGIFTYNVCYYETELSAAGDVCDFGHFKVTSKSLSSLISECDGAIIFAASVGVGIDRLITKYKRISEARALMLGAIGNERIEALCDIFEEDIKRIYGSRTKKRFSPGYGDVPLDLQRDIFRLLDPPRKIGLTLGDSLLMSPTKSVTVIIGINKE